MKKCNCEHHQPERLTLPERIVWFLLLATSAAVTVTGVYTIIGWLL